MRKQREGQEVGDTDEQRYYADGLHGGVAHHLGKLRAHQRTEATADEHGDDVDGGSQAHENQQISGAPRMSLCIIPIVVADVAGV
jgi:hypothetical protein